jgi:alpha-glucosidase (family GH31 glycosyl hydrolase)
MAMRPVLLSVKRAALGFLALRQQDADGAQAEFETERRIDSGCSLAMVGQARLRMNAGSGSDALRLLKGLWRFWIYSIQCFDLDGWDRACSCFSLSTVFFNKMERVQLLPSSRLLSKSTDPLYKSIPFFMTYKAEVTLGVLLDNTWRTSFDFGRELPGTYSFGAVNGPMKYYILYGHRRSR